MIKYFIRTTLERELDESISRELGEDYTLLVDTEHKPVKAFIDCLNVMNDYDSVLLEDDCILCKNFKQHIEEVISKYPDKIINFFSTPTMYQEIKINNNFSFMQCRYYPKGSCKFIAEKLKPYSDRNKVCPNLNLVAREYDLKILHYRPCLVQHLDNDSLVGNLFGKRRTPYFIDYLDELNITYEEANTEEIKVKLIELMNKQIKGIDNK